MKKYGKSLFVLAASLIILLAVIIFNKNFEKEQHTVNTVTDTNTENITELTTAYDTQPDFFHEPVSESLQKYMDSKSYTANGDITFDSLRHVVVKYIDFEGNTKSGELIVNINVADEVVEIFRELYAASYAIEKINLIDDYNGNDEASMEDNNTSCFNYRKIDGQETLSDHSYGLAIDINPLYNPYIRTNMGDRNVLPVNAVDFADRTSDFPHKITKEDTCYKIFSKYGWKWGGEWDSPVDYQHFYKEIR